jgi:hypothetical protein
MITPVWQNSYGSDKKECAHHYTVGVREQNAFDVLKDRLCSAPILGTPRPGEPFSLYTDASRIAVGACLSQDGLEKEGLEHPIAFCSHKLSPTQRACSTIEREAMQ